MTLKLVKIEEYIPSYLKQYGIFYEAAGNRHTLFIKLYTRLYGVRLTYDK